MERRLQWVLDDPARNIESFSWPLTMRLPLISEYRQARLHEFLFDPSTGKERRVQAPGMPGQVSLIGNTPEQDWLALHYGAQYPLRCLRYTGAPDDLRPVAAPLTDIEPEMAIPAEELRPAEDFHYRSGDGTPIQGWLTRANGTARGTILYIHGGPTAHDEDEFSAQAQYLARCGFHIFQPNYRGSTGFSLPFQESIKKQGWGGAEQEDIKAGIEALIAAGVAEPGKIGITGVSYGGYSSWWAITHFPTHLIAAAAPICGMTDLAVDYETTRPDLRPYSEEMMGGTPTQVPERYRERSPINYVENIRGKLLIVQGLNDPNVTPRNVTEVRARLDAAGIPYETLVFADEGHGIAKPANRRTLYLRLAAFFSAAFQAQAA
jgi:dipeptidyl aminopeptidase/acylaminoacyl peptidase